VILDVKVHPEPIRRFQDREVHKVHRALKVRSAYKEIVVHLVHQDRMVQPVLKVHQVHRVRIQRSQAQKAIEEFKDLKVILEKIQLFPAQRAILVLQARNGLLSRVNLRSELGE